MSLLSILGAALILLGLFQAAIYADNPVAERLRTIDPQGRLVYIDIALQILRRHPISGIGMGNFHEALFGPTGSTLDVPFWFYQKTRGTGVHNIYLLFAVESGIIGGILFLLLVLGVAQSLWRAASPRRDGNPETTALAVGLLAGWVGFAASMLFELGFTHPSVQVLFFAIAGIATALGAIKRQSPLDSHKRAP